MSVGWFVFTILMIILALSIFMVIKSDGDLFPLAVFGDLVLVIAGIVVWAFLDTAFIKNSVDIEELATYTVVPQEYVTSTSKNTGVRFCYLNEKEDSINSMNVASCKLILLEEGQTPYLKKMKAEWGIFKAKHYILYMPIDLYEGSIG